LAGLESIDFIKAAILFFLDVLVAPVLGLILRGHPRLQRIAFALMCFMTISGFLKPSEWGLTLGFVDFRGHARGFHFFFNEVFALALIIARVLESGRKFKILPPGLWLYLMYCTLSLISVISAPVLSYAFMSAFKAFKVVVIFIAAYNFIREEEDIRFFLTTMTCTVLWELIVVLKMKYLDHIYQVWGTFEHQNSLSMYAMMIGLVLLASGAGPKHPRSNLFLFGFFCCAAIVESALSRAGVVMFGIGAAAVMLLSLLDKITLRRVVVVSSVCLLGGLGVAMTYKTVINRFHDRGNEESKMTRVMLNQASREMVHDHPLGVGWNNYAVMINKPYRYGDRIDQYFLSFGERIDPKARKGIVESHYYLLLSETGFQGLGSYLIVIAVFLWWNLRAAWAYRQQFLGSVSIGIFIGCTMNYIQSTLERVLTQPRNMMLWMLLLAITAKIAAKAPQSA
jgi:hypothetical protein